MAETGLFLREDGTAGTVQHVTQFQVSVTWLIALSLSPLLASALLLALFARGGAAETGGSQGW